MNVIQPHIYPYESYANTRTILYFLADNTMTTQGQHETPENNMAIVSRQQ